MRLHCMREITPRWIHSTQLQVEKARVEVCVHPPHSDCVNSVALSEDSNGKTFNPSMAFDTCVWSRPCMFLDVQFTASENSEVSS